MRHEEDFVQTILFKCPCCLKDVKIESCIVDGKITWVEKQMHNEECMLAFIPIYRHVPRLYVEERRVAAGHPPIFIELSSKAGIKERLEILKNLLKEMSDEEKRRVEKVISRLNNLLTIDLDQILEKALNAVEAGFFGLRLYAGYRTFVYLWKWGERYFGIAYNENSDHIPFDHIVVTANFSEVKKFMHDFLHYYDKI